MESQSEQQFYVRYRPKRFSDLVGVDQLKPIIDACLRRRQRNMMFTGLNGLGKSTVARIYAMRMSCEKPEGLDPCMECGSCRSFSMNQWYDFELVPGEYLDQERIQDIIRRFWLVPMVLKMRIVLVDDFDFATQPAMLRILSLMNEMENGALMFTATDAGKILLPLRQRLFTVCLGTPSTEGLIKLVSKVCEKEGIKIRDAAAIEILIKLADHNPRVLLNGLEFVSTEGELSIDGVRSPMLIEYMNGQSARIQSQ